MPSLTSCLGCKVYQAKLLACNNNHRVCCQQRHLELSLVSTGYMIASVLVRVLGLSLHKAVGVFAQHRPAGIYKDEYIKALYKYYHEPL